MSQPVLTVVGSAESTATKKMSPVVTRWIYNPESRFLFHCRHWSRSVNLEPSPIPVPNGAYKYLDSSLFSYITSQNYPATAALDDSRCNYNEDLFYEAPWIYFYALADN